MINDMQAQEVREKRARAVKTALVLGAIALAIFTAFVGSAILGR